MAELERIDKVIRATAEEFGHCPGWTQLLAEALTELYETRRKLSTQPATTEDTHDRIHEPQPAD